MSVFERVRKVAIEVLACDEGDITLETHLANDLNADSLDMSELVIALEEEFGISISDDQANEIVTVDDAVKAIEIIVGKEG